MDQLKELSGRIGGKIQPQNHFNVNMGENSFRKLVVKNYRNYKIEVDEYKDLYSIGVNVNSNLSFSINKPDRLFGYKIPKHFSDLPYEIYVSEETYDFVPNKNLEKFWNSLVVLLNRIKLSASECVFVYNNCILFCVTAQKDCALLLDAVIDLISANESIFKRRIKIKISSKNIPGNLQSLIPLLNKYALSDDSDRDQLVGEMDGEEKLKLINLVQPFLHEINIYLDSFKDVSLSEEAILMGELAELVSELNNDRELPG